jgi:hypothetical protein
VKIEIDCKDTKRAASTMAMTFRDDRDLLPNGGTWHHAIALVASSLQFTGLEEDAPSDDDIQDTAATIAIIKQFALDPTRNRHKNGTSAIESTNPEVVAPSSWTRFERSHLLSSSTSPTYREPEPNVIVPRRTTMVEFQCQIIKQREVHRTDTHNRREIASSSTVPNVIAPRGMTVVEYQRQIAARNQPPLWISFEIGSDLLSPPSQDWSLSECAGCEEREMFLEEPSVMDATSKLNASGTNDTLQTTISEEVNPPPKIVSLFRRIRSRVLS